MISYEPLWATLKQKNISQYALIKNYHVSAGQLSRLRANQNVSTHTLDVLCEILDCRLEDVAVYVHKWVFNIPIKHMDRQDHIFNYKRFRRELFAWKKYKKLKSI